MLIISKEEAKLIRRLNKQKKRPENEGLIPAGIGKSALVESFVLGFYDRNMVKNIKMFKVLKKADGQWASFKSQIESALNVGYKNLCGDIKNLEFLIELYKQLMFKNDKTIKILNEFEKQLGWRRKSLLECEKCKIEFYSILEEIK